MRHPCIIAEVGSISFSFLPMDNKTSEEREGHRQEAGAEKRTVGSKRDRRKERKLCKRSRVENGRREQKGYGHREPWPLW